MSSRCNLAWQLLTDHNVSAYLSLVPYCDAHIAEHQALVHHYLHEQESTSDTSMQTVCREICQTEHLSSE